MGDKQSDYLKYRGKCQKMSEALVASNHNLRLVRGYYFCPIWDRDEEHWWCENSLGEVIDPTKKQFPSQGHGTYTEFNGIVHCSECKKAMKEADASFESNYAFCSTSCHMIFVGLADVLNKDFY